MLYSGEKTEKLTVKLAEVGQLLSILRVVHCHMFANT